MINEVASAVPDAAPSLADGRYRLVSVLGRGGMATVYLGFDTRLHIWRAVKVLNPALAASSVIRERFQREARTMVRIRHPNVVAVHDMGQDGNRLYIVMELLPGGSVQHHLQKQGPLPPRQAAAITCDVLRGLGAVHGSHVVHRDVKPANVLLDIDGTPKIGDFGIARLSDEDHPGITRSGAAVGTWAFMAPEQKKNSRVVDGRADVYATGASLFAMLTREEPHDLDRPDVHAETMEGIAAPLREVILRATRYRMEERFGTTDEMRLALEAAMNELPPSPPGAALPLVLPLPHAPPPPAAAAAPSTPAVLSAFPATHSDLPAPAMDTAVPGESSHDLAPVDDFRPTAWYLRWGGLGIGLLVLGAFALLAGPLSDPTQGAAPPPKVAEISTSSVEGPLPPPGPDELVPIRTVQVPGQLPAIATSSPDRDPRGATATPEGDPAPPPATGPPGRLRLEVRGETCVAWIDGQQRSEPLGKVTQFITLPAGPHTVRCVTSRGRSVETAVTIPEDGLYTLCLDMTTQRICM